MKLIDDDVVEQRKEVFKQRCLVEAAVAEKQSVIEDIRINDIQRGPLTGIFVHFARIIQNRVQYCPSPEALFAKAGDIFTFFQVCFGKSQHAIREIVFFTKRPRVVHMLGQ